jgi:hypothetical protein
MRAVKIKMFPMSYKTKTIALLILAICSQACGILKRNVQSGANAITDRYFIVPMAVSQSLKDASRKIYSNHSLKDGTAVVIETFNVRFFNQIDSFPLQMNNISFYWSGDSVYYKNFNFPKWDINKYADTMRSVFNSSYRISGGTEIQCMSGEYSIKSGEIEKVAEFKPCMQ